MKTHFKDLKNIRGSNPVCGHTGYNSKVTEDPDKAKCKACKKYVEKKKLREGKES